MLSHPDEHCSIFRAYAANLSKLSPRIGCADLKCTFFVGEMMIKQYWFSTSRKDVYFVQVSDSCFFVNTGSLRHKTKALHEDSEE